MLHFRMQFVFPDFLRFRKPAHFISSHRMFLVKSEPDLTGLFGQNFWNTAAWALRFCLVLNNSRMDSSARPPNSSV